MPRQPHCDTCTCGLVAVEWSDRSGYYDPDDADSIVETVMSCCLDHSYDRTDNGIPYGMDDKYSELLAPVIATWFRQHHPEWFDHTVWLTEPERIALKQVLLTAVNGNAES